MLLDLQKSMLASAYNTDKALINEIFGVAMLQSDWDTCYYIAQHYQDCFEGDILNEIKLLAQVTFEQFYAIVSFGEVAAEARYARSALFEDTAASVH